MTHRSTRESYLARILVQGSLDGLSVLDCNRRYTLWNAAMERYTTKRADEVLGRSVFELFPIVRELGIDHAFERAFEGEEVEMPAVPMPLPDGTIGYFDMSFTPLRDDAGAVIGMVAAIRDVSARQNAEEALRSSQEKLRQAQKLEALGQLTAGIAHNFNNILMALLPNLEIAASTAPPDLIRCLKDAEDAAHRASNLVGQLMTFAGGNRTIPRSVESVAVLVERTLSFCRSMLDRRITVETGYDRDALAMVEASQLEQAVLNVLINARDVLCDGHHDDPRIFVDVAIVQGGAPELDGRDRDHVRIRIRDNGTGMDAATQARIFDPFFTTKGAGRGTGLGLATTHAMIREHGGFVVCDSSPNQGATFSIYLPRQLVAHAPPAPPPSAPAVQGVETILVVDDEAPIRTVVSRMLEGGGYTSIVAGSGQEALDVLSRDGGASKVALVLLDVSMPGLSGRELRRRIRDLVPDARLVYFTGYAADGIDMSGPEAPDGVIEKPVTTPRLLGTIRDVLDRSGTS